MSAKKKDLLSSAMKRTSEWISSQEVSSDVTVHVGEASFSLHKFPLLSKCGFIKKLMSGSNKDSDSSVIKILDIPGGSEAFELAAKFCYGINFDMSTENIAMLRCAAEYLEMTDEHSVENLVVRAEAYLNEVALKSLSSSITVLHKSEELLPTAERVKLVSRCIDAIAYMTCQESHFCSPSSSNSGNNEVVVQQQSKQPVVDWWAEDLTVLRIDSFQRVLIAMMARGFKQYGLGPVLMLYAQKSLRGLEIFGKGMKKIEPKQEHEKRVILETIVSLLPREKNAMSVSFLSMLLRAAIYLETTVACRLDLEKRMGLQLGQAVLDDLLIPSYSFTGDHSLFDTDTVQRILMNYLEFEVEGVRISNNGVDLAGDMERVGKLLENYMAEIASDRNVSLQKFIGLAELIPEQSRVTEDGMYRAVDIYLKAHPNMSDVERKKVCSLMDCQKLSREACAHAAQNDRLPVQTIVQVLYYEQQRLRGEVTNDSDSPAPPPPAAAVLPPKLSSYNDELSKLKRENQDLKLELLKMKMKLKEFEKESDKKSSSSTISTNPNSPISTASMDKPPLPRKSFINSVSRKLGKLNPFGITPYSGRGRTKPPKDRRHSIS
ncbi:PREDICTED: BTB/POZ domain-containing protein At5g67385-like isoform X1 [Camelina sativa]|uniref:BTB/POZ domain-containing protein At5g67385-like isoform X1 n=2 Tax=Camelina sativa TaxID=90675 RepID=A0ABM0XDZ0_CAMSA|nr:PREDICTED: BTB/POZ domain-containing protein At5g67385-like isoform X1 [Camelina sativa]XP_010484508.1 PREDICTED: BTB/POZ domain-containing protein At5g67385-like isoform X1 [Camelina sativa]